MHDRSPTVSEPAKDVYPADSTIPRDCLTPPQAQPDYSTDFVAPVDDWSNVGHYLSDRQAELGRGALAAAIDAETGRILTFDELARRSTALAAGLVARGTRPGDRIAFRSPNVAEALVVMTAIWKSGGVITPIPVQATPTDIRFYLEDSGARFLFAHARAGLEDDIRAMVGHAGLEEVFAFGDYAPGGVFRHADDLALIGADAGALPRTPSDSLAILWHTGGTTGHPKGCYHTHRRFLLGGFSIGAASAIEPGERWAAAAPIGHALGLIHNTIYTLLHGGTSIMIERFHDPAVLLDAIDRWQVHTMTGLSASWGKMLELAEAAPERAASIRRAFAMWQSASASEVYDGWRRRGVELLNNFGSTSFATWVIVPERGSASPRAALGKAAPGYRIEAIETDAPDVRPVARGAIGRLAVRGPTGLTYWNLPELQARDVVDGWTLSDDLIRFDEEGHIHYLGRTDFMISTGGFKVAPVEVENVLSRHPAVEEVAVVPGPCPRFQEMVVAFVVPAAGFRASAALAEELSDYAKAELVSYKCPRRIEFIDALPRDPMGKVRTGIVKDWAAGT